MRCVFGAMDRREPRAKRARVHRMRLLNGTAAIFRIAFERIVDALEDHFFDFFDRFVVTYMATINKGGKH